MIERNYSVAGMHCASCVALIRDEVGELDGVESVDVDLERGRMTVRYDDARVPEARILEAVGEAGYSATPE